MMVCRGHTRTLNGGEPIWNEIVVGEQLWGRGEGMATGNRGRSQRGEEGDGLSSRKKNTFTLPCFQFISGTRPASYDLHDTHRERQLVKW